MARVAIIGAGHIAKILIDKFGELGHASEMAGEAMTICGTSLKVWQPSAILLSYNPPGRRRGQRKSHGYNWS